MSANNTPKILIAGAGIAGTTTAYWLGRAGYNVTVVERCPQLRTAGQGIDMEGPAVEVVRKMGLEETIRAKTTGEKGVAFVDEKNTVFATFDVGDKGTDIGFTSEIEIMRGDLCDILYNAANAFPNVTFLFDSKLQELQQSPTSVSITLSDGTSSNYDMVVAADGFRSGTRKLILEDEDDQTNIKSQNCWIAYFSIPCQPQDGPRSRGYNAVGGRFVMVRPRDEKISCAYLLVSHDAKALREASRAGMPAQKAALAEVFADAGWEVTRVLEGMKDTEDFYLQEIAKIELGAKGWSKERCALVGDAAYCSFTGTGTTLAILGGYVLAGEILLSHMELAVAFKAYEDKLSGYVVKAQSAPGGPEMFVPQTWLGVKIIRTLLWFASWSGIARWLGGYKMPKFEVPEYDFDGRQL